MTMRRDEPLAHRPLRTAAPPSGDMTPTVPRMAVWPAGDLCWDQEDTSTDGAEDPASAEYAAPRTQRSGLPGMAPWQKPQAALAIPSAAPSAEASARMTELVGFDPEVLVHLHQQPSWLALADQVPASADPDRRARALVAHVLAHAAPSLCEPAIARGDLGALLASTPPGEAPLALLSGALVFPPDDVEVLASAVHTAAPLAANHDALRDLLQGLKQVLDMPIAVPPDLARGLLLRLREALTEFVLPVSADILFSAVDRALLLRRCYQERPLFDGPHLRALFTPAGQDVAIPAYVPPDLRRRLPLFRSFEARLLVDVWSRQDETEAHPLCLRVRALSRIVG
jgi:hypothetical protein